MPVLDNKTTYRYTKLFLDNTQSLEGAMYNFIHRHGIPMFIRAYLGRHIGDESATREVEEYLHKTNHNKYGLLRFVETLTEMQGVLPKAWVNLILIKLLRSLLKTLTNEDLLKILDAYCNLAIQTIPIIQVIQIPNR